jgi:hypothetical protein
LALEPGLSVFQFCEVDGSAIIYRGLCQIWLKVREKSGIFFKPHYLLATFKNLWSKYGEFNFFYLNMAIYGFFPPKESFGQVTPRPPFFCCQVAKIPHKKKLAGT